MQRSVDCPDAPPGSRERLPVDIACPALRNLDHACAHGIQAEPVDAGQSNQRAIGGLGFEHHRCGSAAMRGGGYAYFNSQRTPYFV